jgi:hypothetical protein
MSAAGSGRGPSGQCRPRKLPGTSAHSKIHLESRIFMRKGSSIGDARVHFPVARTTCATTSWKTCFEDMLYCKNREPPLDELLNDPIVRLVMARDGLSADDVGAYVDIARRRMREQQTSDEWAFPARKPHSTWFE